ncbi:R-phenyllactate dehydratase activator [Oxobacter pfennigii]|uniref:R-phenyllactate dehydratase activator n=1 Tax=Oxobacter pfennigii TaxID=36849 RepID=A0A0P8WBT5_9CLOT|nr:acyl-CoA dehydratase activase [Oxobacter pfennigii]KPU46118.1 R-phenyllactate dehydratase activator [Oxobacter pfennigii]
MFYVGIDIGSTASKVSVLNNDNKFSNFILPTGWSSIDTAKTIEKKLSSMDVIKSNSKIVATGYGRVSVPYADKTVTEITCHGKGAYYITGEDLTVIDIGGQDTKIITIKKGNIVSFTMNDKCAAGTGRFLELMAGSLGVSIDDLSSLALRGKEITITSMCTVFAESEVISLIGSGAKREDIASGIISSIAGRVKSLCQKHGQSERYFLTGGLCENPVVIERIAEKLNKPVFSKPDARFAGSIGAALTAKNL